MWGRWYRMRLERGLDGHEKGFEFFEQVALESSCPCFQGGTESLMEK